MSKKWYIVHAYSNFEKKVAEAIKENIKTIMVVIIVSFLVGHVTLETSVLTC